MVVKIYEEFIDFIGKFISISIADVQEASLKCLVNLLSCGMFRIVFSSRRLDTLFYRSILLQIKPLPIF